MTNDEDSPRATFTHMAQCTKADASSISSAFVRTAAGLPDRVLEHLALLGGEYGGFPIDRLTHSRQCATLAYDDGRDEEYVVCALLHDIGDTLGCYNHADIAAAILKPFVSEANHWMVQHHGIFQGYYFFRHVGVDVDLRAALRDHPCYARTEEFVTRYDAPAFDPERPTRSLAFFEPMVRRVFARPRRSVPVESAGRARDVATARR